VRASQFFLFPEVMNILKKGQEQAVALLLQRLQFAIGFPYSLPARHPLLPPLIPENEVFLYRL
jgi:hypothetical protein